MKSCNLTIIQEYFQPKIGRKIRIFSLGRKTTFFLFFKKSVYACRPRVERWSTTNVTGLEHDLFSSLLHRPNSSLFSKLVFQIRSKLVDSLATSFDLQDNEQAQVAMSALITVSQKKTELTPQTQVWIWSSFAPPASTLIGSLNKDVFERRMSTGNWLFLAVILNKFLGKLSL